MKKNRWSKLPISHRGAIIIAIPAICLLATLGAWIWSRQININLTQNINQLQNIINKSQSLFITLIDAENSLQAYHLTGNSSFIKNYEQAKTNLPSAFNKLEKVGKNEIFEQEIIRLIKPLIVEQNLIFDKIVKVSNTQEKNQLFNESKNNIKKIRTKIADLQQVNQMFLEAEEASLQNVRQIITIIQWSAAWLSGTAYWAAVYLFTKLDQELQTNQLQLQENKSFVETITSNIIDAVITLKGIPKTPPDCDQPIETFNPAASEMFGYCPTEVVGKNLSLLLIDPQIAKAEQQQQLDLLNTQLSQENPRWQTFGYRQNGTMFPIEISVSDMKHAHRFMVIIRDVTESQKAKDKLEAKAKELTYITSVLAQANKDLEKQNQELDKFAYVASHDLKAPLRAIATLSEWIEEDLEDKLPDENRHQMQLLRGRVKRLADLIDALLEYSRIGRIQTVVEQTDVKELIEQIITKLQVPSQFHLELATPMPVLITQKVLLQQVLYHLLSNALKHHEATHGHIMISVKELNEDFYEFAIADDGPGIPSQYHEKIFVIFQTLYPRDTKENTGVGLAVVKKIVETVGGKIRVESEEGQGAIFYFTWPKK